MEIERKYLVGRLPEGYDRNPHVEIEQGYICQSPTLRIRKAGDSYILTVKEHRPFKGVIVNREEEFALSESSYRSLKEKCEGRFVAKTRYRIPLDGGLVAELDLFHGCHEGLQLVEVEFPSVEASLAFQEPDWFGRNVSDDPRYRNSYLSSVEK